MLTVLTQPSQQNALQQHALWTSQFAQQGNAYQHPGYGQAYPGFCVAVWQTDRLQVWHPVIITPLPPHAQPSGHPTLHDAQSPFGVGGPIVIGKPTHITQELPQFWQAWQHWCQQHHVIAELVRFDPLQQNHTPWAGLLSQASPKDTLWINLTHPLVFAHRCQRNLTKALQMGVTATYNNWADWPAFVNTYTQLMASKPDGQSYCWPNSTMTTLQQHAQHGDGVLQSVWHQGQYVGGSLFLTDAGGRAYYHLGAITPAGKAVKASHASLAGMLQHLHAIGYTACFLGGGVQPNDSLQAYKAQFTLQPPQPYIIGTAVHHQAAYNAVKAHTGQVKPPRILWYR
jgi:hypothetical protein